jgi:hypothetical protein
VEEMMKSGMKISKTRVKQEDERDVYKKEKSKKMHKKTKKEKSIEVFK